MSSSPAEIVREVHELLSDAPSLSELRVADLDHAPDLDPPAVVVGPPEWQYRTSTTSPVDYTLTVFVVVANSERAVTQLLELVPRVAAVLDEPAGVIVRRVRVGTFPTGNAELPAYMIDIEAAS